MSFIFFFWGGGVLSSSIAKRKAPYTLQQSCTWYLVHMIAVCSAVGRIATILLYVYCLIGTKKHGKALRHYWIVYSYWCCMRGHRSRRIFWCHMSQKPVLWASAVIVKDSDAGVIVNFFLGHTFSLLISWRLRAIFILVSTTSSPQQLTLA